MKGYRGRSLQLISQSYTQTDTYDRYQYNHNHFYNSEHKHNPNKKFRKELFLDSYGEKVKELLCKQPLYYIKKPFVSPEKPIEKD